MGTQENLIFIFPWDRASTGEIIISLISLVLSSVLYVLQIFLSNNFFWEDIKQSHRRLPNTMWIASVQRFCPLVIQTCDGFLLNLISNSLFLSYSRLSCGTGILVTHQWRDWYRLKTTSCPFFFAWAVAFLRPGYIDTRPASPSHAENNYNHLHFIHLLTPPRVLLNCSV